jgi:ankyrin repeat protein
VRLLLEHSVDINAKDGNGETALHAASRDGHDAVVWLLLEDKADVDAKDTPCRLSACSVLQPEDTGRWYG